MSDIPDTNDINKLAAWFDKDTLELIGHILNKHTKACLSQMKELVIERKELKKRLAEAEELKADFKKAMKLFEDTGLDNLLWKLLDTITKGE